MMAILPPTSPTTVIGGFSLAIITAKERKTGYHWEEQEEELFLKFYMIKSKSQ